MKRRIWILTVLASALVFAFVGGCSAEAPAPATAGSGGSSGGGGAGGGCAVGLQACATACADVRTDPANCGSCGTTCSGGQACQASQCQCLSGLTACTSGCSALGSDAANCGSCGNACAAGLVCSLGQCSATCAAGLVQCGQSCVDEQSSVTHCGACNNACPAGLACTNGSCACPTAGQVSCSGQCADVTTSAAHCGACGNACGAGQTCQAGSCVGGAGGSGGAGTGGVGGSGGTPTNLPGVVVSTDAAGTLGCVPLCQMATHPDDTDPTDDWAYEGYSCVLPSSPTGTRNTPCTTGQPLPPINRDGFPGVVVGVDSAGTLGCVPLCAEGAVPSSPDAPDWGWEFQATCIIRETTTSTCNQTCVTGQALPSPTLIQRAGVVIDDACVALCACSSASSDPSWGWEFQGACVMPGSTPATGVPACTTNTGEMLTPPPLTRTTRAPGFYTENGRLYDAYGNEFVMRGVNNPHIWFDTGNQYRAYQALDAIASYGTNTIRVVWETTGGSPALLSRILYRIVELDMVPMIELHDVTGATGNADLARMASYYARSDVSAVLQAYRAYLLINIANEWSGNDFRNAYTSAVTTLRNAGLDHTLVIDANGFGQNASSIFDNATALLNADPRRNLLFSVHMYTEYGSANAVNAVLDRAASESVPFIVGEFGPRLQGTNVAWEQILTKCAQHRIGYLAWSWSGNDSSTANLNIVNDFGGALTPQWGQLVMVESTNGIQRTAQRASIFQ